MKFIAVAVVLLLSVFATSADRQAISPSIVNGEDASIADHPYMAKVCNLNWAACGGAIITSRNVLTAAHCLDARISRPALVSVVVGSSHRRGEDGQRHSALRLFIHPEYMQTSLVNDVAVIRTISRIVFTDLVQPIQLRVAEVEVGTEGIFVGWGADSYGLLPRRADLLQQMNYRTISNEQCREMYSVTHRGDFVVDQKLCILSGPRTSVCSGDSGSPLVVNGEVAGVVSWRTMPCGDGLPDVFIRVSYVRDWILSVV